MQGYDFSEGFDSQTSSVLFVQANEVTTEYQVVMSGDKAAIQRQETRVGGAVRTTLHFVGQVVMPQAADDTTHFFTTPSAGACPCETVKIRFRMIPPHHAANPLEYSTDATVRGFTE
jgi:hypothetical protein